jgi:hypothetical protein
MLLKSHGKSYTRGLSQLNSDPISNREGLNDWIYEKAQGK